MAGPVDMGGRRAGRRWKPKAEINIVPYVDVMLVLLIVFMVAAPLLTVGVDVSLPDTEARAMTTSEEPLTITIQADGTLFLQETRVTLRSWCHALRRCRAPDPKRASISVPTKRWAMARSCASWRASPLPVTPISAS